jgi:hypothetical protein
MLCVNRAHFRDTAALQARVLQFPCAALVFVAVVGLAMSDLCLVT